MYFNFNTTANNSKTTLQRTIKQKQALFNRFKRRFQVSTNPSEKRFIKTECSRVVTELKQCSRQWVSSSFGAATWITKNFKASLITGGKTVSRSNNRKTYRKTTSRSSAGRSYGSRTRSRTSAARRASYVAW